LRSGVLCVSSYEALLRLHSLRVGSARSEFVTSTLRVVASKKGACHHGTTNRAQAVGGAEDGDAADHTPKPQSNGELLLKGKEVVGAGRACEVPPQRPALRKHRGRRFCLQLLAARKDSLQLTPTGQHAVALDRCRLLVEQLINALVRALHLCVEIREDLGQLSRELHRG